MTTGTFDIRALKRFLLNSGVEPARAQALVSELDWALSPQTTASEIESLLAVRLSLAEALGDMRLENRTSNGSLDLALRLFRTDALAYQRACAASLRITVRLLLALLVLQIAALIVIGALWWSPPGPWNALVDLPAHAHPFQIGGDPPRAA